MTPIAIKMIMIGRPTQKRTIVPPSKRPSTMVGSTKNIPSKYRMANQRYFAVSFPRNLASGNGNRIKGIG